MTQDPYRPAEPTVPNPELLRLAQQGHERRRAAVARGAELRGPTSGHLSTAIGAYRGSAIRRFFLAVMLGGLATGVVGLALGKTQLQAGPNTVGLDLGFIVAFAAFFIYVFVPPKASRRAIEAERAWATSRPFELAGYFDVLSVEPTPACVIELAVTWRAGTRPPDGALLHGVLGAVDPGARVDWLDAYGATITSSPISGSTGICVNNVPVFRNHRVPERVHLFVDKALDALHRSYPIDRVTLTRRR